MMKSFVNPEFELVRNEDKCIQCEVCVRQCSNEVHEYDKDDNCIISFSEKCVGCQRCVTLCPTDALDLKPAARTFKQNDFWTPVAINGIIKQAETGGVLLSAMGSDKKYKIYFDHLLLDAAQVTNPSIDPLREPMELKTLLGAKPDRLEFDKKGELKTEMPPQLITETPILFSAMSYGAISYNSSLALAMAAEDFGTYYNCGEGGLHRDFYKYSSNTIVQVASGRFGVHSEYLEVASAVEIKVGQGAKPGIGGHLPGTKVTEEVSKTRMIPEGSDALSPAPHHDIYSIEDLSQLIYSLKEAIAYSKPIMVKVSAVHNIAAISSGIVHAGADIVVIDGIRGGTGAAPTRIRDNVGIPIELAIASVDDRLRSEGIRRRVSLIAAGGIRNSADVVKAIALGADAVYIGTAALIAMGCHLCQKCYTGKCNWGIATNDDYLVKRLNPNIAKRKLLNLIGAWSLEIKEMLGGMGINAIESLRGNRLRLRGVDLTPDELKVLGIKQAGESL